jgi:CMP-N,N'-diacetyllegionaminic acid synthase
MIEGHGVLAIVPARSGSKGIRDKNMTVLGGLSLIARAGELLARIAWIDRKVISTDSPRYAEEAQAHGLEAPFLRPESLSNDDSGALETIVHALLTCEQYDRKTYDLIVLVEPTSPLRQPSDIELTVRTLLRTGADSALTVSLIDTKSHPDKIFSVEEGLLKFFTPTGKNVTRRQRLTPLYSRNGLCYCFWRETLLTKQALITQNTVPVFTDRPVANIDEPLDLLWAQFLLDKAVNNYSVGCNIE